MRILVVEDQQTTLQALGSLFTMEGHTVTLTKSASEALAHVANNNPDVILLDIGLPGMDGFQVAKAVRSLELKPRPLIIAYSGYAKNDDLVKGRQAGFDYHFPKTISPQTLLAIIHEHRQRNPMGKAGDAAPDILVAR
jgi:DNA-binding response OmpR family regulator